MKVPYSTADGPAINPETMIVHGTDMHRPTSDGHGCACMPTVVTLTTMTAREAHQLGTRFLCGATRCFGDSKS